MAATKPKPKPKAKAKAKVPPPPAWQEILDVLLPCSAPTPSASRASTSRCIDPDPTMGRPMREWLHVTAPSDWGPLVEQGLSHCIAPAQVIGYCCTQ